MCEQLQNPIHPRRSIFIILTAAGCVVLLQLGTAVFELILPSDWPGIIRNAVLALGWSPAIVGHFSFVILILPKLAILFAVVFFAGRLALPSSRRFVLWLLCLFPLGDWAYLALVCLVLGVDVHLNLSFLEMASVSLLAFPVGGLGFALGAKLGKRAR
jgi:hypothetical protein